MTRLLALWARLGCPGICRRGTRRLGIGRSGIGRSGMAHLGAAVLASVALLGCDRGRDDVREWTPQDHDHTGGPSAGQVDTSQTGASPLAAHGISDVILATWKQNCVTCHGVIGRGDGPQGPMVRPPDFTHPVWQKNARDDHMRRTIKQGRGAMPGFGHLPDETVDGLVQLIRLLNRERAATAPPEGAAPPSGAAPSEGAAPPNGAGAPKPPGHP